VVRSWLKMPSGVHYPPDSGRPFIQRATCVTFGCRPIRNPPTVAASFVGLRVEELSVKGNELALS
jgi:hypothetical protein